MDIPDIKIILGGLAVAVGLLAFVPYFRDLIRGTTKPHLFSWFIWGLVYAMAFAAQITEGAGAGAWFVGAEAIACFAIASAALFRGEKGITKMDWTCFVIALCGVVLWWSTSDPLWAVIAAVVVEVFAFAPTYRKSYFKPHEETASAYAGAVVAVALSLLALESYSLTTWLYPLAVAVTNSGFVLMLFIRRVQIKNS